MSKEFDEFDRLMKEHSKKSIQDAQVWVIVKSVDWDDRTMTATSVVDDLDYYDVQLGLGSYYRKPKVGTRCLLGLPNSQNAATFLIEAEAFEEAVFTSADSVLTIKESGFVFQKGDLSLKEQLDDLIGEINKLNREMQKVVVSIGTTPNVVVLKQIEQATNAIKSKIDTIIVA